ncbi:MAG: hypothetical protein IKQ71_09070 [Lachnospiraceae bacterium]|nr:hypothetical protein [Lachnospiraceae bacterium]
MSDQNEKPVRRFDPKTGKPLAEVNETPVKETPKPEVLEEAVKEAPKESQKETAVNETPVENIPVEPRKPIRYDTTTGEPIYEEAPKEPKKPLRYDTATGEPIYEEPEPKKIVGYDTKTGEPIYDNARVNAPVRNNPVSFGSFNFKPVLYVIAALLVIFLSGFAVFKSGIVLKPAEKVYLAAEKTLKANPFAGSLIKASDRLTSNNYTVDFDATGRILFASMSVKGSMTKKSKDFGLTGSASMGSQSYDVEALLDKDSIKFRSSMLGPDRIFAYNYRKDNTGYLVTSMGPDKIKELNNALQAAYDNSDKSGKLSKSIKAATRRFIKSLPVEKAEKRNITIGGKDRSCAGYTFSITGADFAGYLDQVRDITYESVYGEPYAPQTTQAPSGEEDEDYYDYSYRMDPKTRFSAMFDELKEEFPATEVIQISFYLSGGRLVGATFVNRQAVSDITFQGKNDPTTEIVMRSGTRTLTGDQYDETLMIKGIESGTTTTYSMYEGNDLEGTLSYDTESGLFSMGEGKDYVSGTFKVEKDKVTIAMRDDDMSVEAIIRGADKLPKLKGDAFDIGNASQSELQSAFVGTPLYDELAN